MPDDDPQPTIVYRWADVITVDIDPAPPAQVNIDPAGQIPFFVTLGTPPEES